MEWIPVFAYLLALAGGTVLGAPTAAALFRYLPRRGAAFAFPSALVPFTITVFWVGQLSFGLHTLLLGVAVVAASAALLWRRGSRPDWGAVATMYAVFVLGFLLMVAFRASNPAITPQAGEQFLHFALVNALERAPSLPPEDMWFAGESLKYYYGTQLQVTSLAMLTGTALRYGFNLGIATFYKRSRASASGLVPEVLHKVDHSALPEAEGEAD